MHTEIVRYVQLNYDLTSTVTDQNTIVEITVMVNVRMTNGT